MVSSSEILWALDTKRKKKNQLKPSDVGIFKSLVLHSIFWKNC